PYSRYGMGDIVPNQNIVSRSMGGISAAFIDSVGFIPYNILNGVLNFPSSSINLSNPASLGSLNTTIFDVGGEVDVRTLKSNNSPQKYKATNTLISYIQLGFPVTPKKMLAKGNYVNIAFGLRPVTRINYKILADKRLAGIDSVSTLFEGTGGISQANFSTGVKIKNFSFGASTGYAFGNRQNSTKLSFNNDSVHYMQSNTQADSRFGGFFLTLGAQYSVRLKNKNVLRLGVTSNLQQKLKAKRDNINETFVYNSSGSVISIDTVTNFIDQKGSIILPATYTVGFTYTTKHWIVGADIDYAQWSKYRYFGAKDAVQNNTTVHIGGQYFPAEPTTPSSKYWKFVKYRAGLYFGNDYVKINNTNKPDYGITLGASLPLSSFQRLRVGEFVTLNTGMEIGQRGNKQSQSLREGIVRFDIGISMSTTWFQKSKYN
ncbi:MAG: hypothetical protein H7320_03620, partial [Ferruginibacter sp.]|nr:hypothetical protein [Ferruginibacter sp.]